MSEAEKTSLKLEVEIECGFDTALLNDLDWFVLSGGTPRKDRNHRRATRTSSWRFIDLCSWIGRKVNNLFKNDTLQL